MAATGNVVALDGAFLKLLERHELVSHRVFGSGLIGQRRSRRRGSGMEFADYKEYAPGDDFRYLDWNVYARCEQLVVKVFETTENLATYVLLDRSASMGFGDPSKLLWAERLAAAIGYLAMGKEDKLAVYPFAERLDPGFTSLRGRGQWGPLLGFLGRLEPSGQTALETVFREFATAVPPGGLVFLLSDLWDLDGFERGLKYLIYNNFVVFAVHLLSPEEQAPAYLGEYELSDAEGTGTASVTVKAGTLANYQRELERVSSRLQGLLRSYDSGYLRTTTATSVEETVLQSFRKERIIG